jgi:hypothetical protein
MVLFGHRATPRPRHFVCADSPRRRAVAAAPTLASPRRCRPDPRVLFHVFLDGETTRR